jgi:hypothetical protein
LWITSDKWFSNIDSWMNDDWENLDAVGCERFVEDGYRTMN